MFMSLTRWDRICIPMENTIQKISLSYNNVSMSNKNRVKISRLGKNLNKKLSHKNWYNNCGSNCYLPHLLHHPNWSIAYQLIVMISTLRLVIPTLKQTNKNQKKNNNNWESKKNSIYTHTIPGRTKWDHIISDWSCTGYNTGKIVISKARSCRASCFEQSGIIGSQTRRRSVEFPSATILIFVKYIASTPTRDDLPVGFQGQLRRAVGPQIGVTSGGAAVPFAAERLHDDRQVEAVDEADVIVVDISQGKFRDWSRGAACPCALHQISTPTYLVQDTKLNK